MNRRKKNSGLTADDVQCFLHLWSYARWAGIPLNILITVKPCDVDDLSLEQKLTAFDRVKNAIGQFSRRNGFDLYYIWVREIACDGHGEHIHILCHVPRRFHPSFFALSIRWLPGNQIDVREAGYGQTVSPDGGRRNIALYLAKQMTSQAAFGRRYRRQKGGVIQGKRWGHSHSLTEQKRLCLEARMHKKARLSVSIKKR